MATPWQMADGKPVPGTLSIDTVFQVARVVDGSLGNGSFYKIHTMVCSGTQVTTTLYSLPAYPGAPLFFISSTFFRYLNYAEKK